MLTLIVKYESSPFERPSELIGATSGGLGYLFNVVIASDAACLIKVRHKYIKSCNGRHATG